MNDDVIHVNGKVDPESDIETIATELILADLQTIENQLPRLEKELRGKKIDKSFMDNVLAAQKVLEEGKTLYAAGAAAGVDLEEIASLQLMTTKPFIYVFNTDEAGLADTEMQAKLSELVAPAEAIFLDAQFEAELAELEEDEAVEMLEDAGIEESGLDKLARVGFDTLGLQTYLTAGPKETRAWTIPKGATAPEAAG